MTQACLNVSVIILTYDGAAFIHEALESVFAQTLLPREIIVVDDASTDDTPDMVASIAATAPVPLRLIRLKTNSGGPAHPMNVGIEHASAEFIALFDQDDRMASSKLEAQGRLFIQDNKLGLVFGQGRRISATDELGRDPAHLFTCFDSRNATPFQEGGVRIAAEDALRLLLNHGYNYGGAGGTSVSKDVWRALGGFDERLKIAWDFDYALRITSAGYAVGYTPKIVYYHRRHRANLELADDGRRLREERVMVLRRQADAGHLPPEFKQLAQDAYRRELMGAVYWYRENREYKHALKYLYVMIRRYGLRVAVATSLVKLGIHLALVNFLRLPRWSSDKGEGKNKRRMAMPH